MDWEGARLCRVAGRKTWGATQRAFFLGDFFLYTSKEKSYPLLRRRSGSSAFKIKTKKELDSSLTSSAVESRWNDERVG
jgi:hypothetical protein